MATPRVPPEGRRGRAGASVGASAHVPDPLDLPDPLALAAGAAQLGVPLAPAQLDALLRYARLLAKWNAVHNLTAIESGARVLTHHLLDALALVAHVAHVAHPTGAQPPRVLDVGSGGGLPGLPLAIALPAVQVTVLDKVQKKAAFLTQARIELALANVQVVHARVEEHRPGEPYDLITARAFAALGDFVRWTAPLLAPGGRWLAMKGALDADELAALPATVRVTEIIPLDVPGLAARRHLIVLERADPLSPETPA